MRILALETSGTSGSVALVEAAELRNQLILDPTGRTARSLAPGIRQLLAEAGWTPRQIELVAVSIGPGSFTGLRLGVMTAKAFAYAVGATVLGVGTLEASAARAPVDSKLIAVASDAQRGEVYCQTFERTSAGDPLRAQQEARIFGVPSWLDSLPTGACVTGPALIKLADQLPAHVTRQPAETWSPDAATVGLLAARHFAAGQRDDVWKLAPLYLRRSAAEEKWAARSSE